MVIDFHTHIRRNEGSPADFVAEMDRLGIDKAVVAALIPPTPELGDGSNEYTCEVVQRYPDRLIGFACVMPMERNAPDQLEYWVTQKGFKGLKLHPPIQNFAPNDPVTYPVIRKAIELDIPILYHTGPIYVRSARQTYGDPNLLDELALTFPEAKIVGAHCDPLGWLPAIAGKHPNLYMDTSVHFPDRCQLIPGLGEMILTRATSGISSLADKTLFGSDANPTYGLKRFEQNVEPLRNLQVSDEIKRKVLGLNAARLLKLEVTDEGGSDDY
ncbi:MAG: amidohydrolase family protein [Ardenticatenaceae bacterium]|nr:amidohydrolase family protein [Ardenticatenaceae bacterium]